jgi:hypothetical protein
MRITNAFFVALISTLLAAPVLAQNAPPQDGQAPPQGGAQASQSDGLTLDATPFFNEVNTTHDGKITLDQWKAAGLPENVFSMFDSDKKGYITKEHMASMKHPPSIDTDHSGKLTLAKLKAHVASQSGGAPK